MTANTPQKMLDKTNRYFDELQAAKTMSVVVGLPSEKVGGKVYGDGNSIIKIGAIHEFGAVDGSIPRRSFLRVPFKTKRKVIDDQIASQFKQLSQGKKTAAQALGLIGLEAESIAKGAFTSKGYGEWADINAKTKARKGSAQPLIDTGTLRRSVTSVVRK